MYKVLFLPLMDSSRRRTALYSILDADDRKSSFLIRRASQCELYLDMYACVSRLVRRSRVLLVMSDNVGSPESVSNV